MELRNAFSSKQDSHLWKFTIHDTVHELPRPQGYLWPEPLKEAKDALPKDLDGRSDEARHGKAFEGLLKRYFGK